ncbi:MAG: GNAT family N-acetyltransferase [Methanobacteriota archaeon]|nr:MAG: GNAT family N-acetyltransferase [Euryarchaeota archaeon]
MVGAVTVEDRTREEGSAVYIRPYLPSDRDRCVTMSVEAWPRMSSGLPGRTASDFWGMLLDIANDYSDVREVACASTSVVGVLLGRRRGSLSTRESISQVRIFLSFLRSISRKLPLRTSTSMFCTLLLTEVKIMFNSPRSDGEVAFLVVDPRYQGRGIGLRLLDNFITQARSSDVHMISVYTTDPGCNWRFYEKRGFRRVAQFEDDFGTRFEGERSSGLMYALDLLERPL